MTRQEYMCREVENLIHNVVIPQLEKQGLKEEEVKTINMKGFLYSVSRLDCLEYLMIVSRYLDNESFEKVMEYFKERGNL